MRRCSVSTDHRFGARSGRFAADIDNRGAAGEQLVRPAQRVIDGKRLPPSENESGVTLITPTITARSSGNDAARVPPLMVVLRRAAPCRSPSRVPAPVPAASRGARTRPGASAPPIEDQPVIAGDEFEAETGGERHHRLDDSGSNSGDVKCRGVESAGGEAREIALPSVGQEGVTDRGRAVRQRGDDHAPAGSAGGAPRIGGVPRNAGDSRPTGTPGGADGGGGAAARGGSGRFLASRSRSSRSIVSRSSSARAIRSSRSRFSLSRRNAVANASSTKRFTSSSTSSAVRSDVSRRLPNSRPRKTSCSRSPTAISPTTSLIPYSITMRRASAVACWMSPPAPVVTAPLPKMISSAARPP